MVPSSRHRRAGDPLRHRAIRSRPHHPRGVGSTYPHAPETRDHRGREDAACPAADASYSGRRLQTILFNHRDAEWLNGNLEAGRHLVAKLSDSPRNAPRDGITVVGPFESDLVIAFLQSYRFHENSRDLNSELIVKYIRARRSDGELRHFKLAVMGRPKPTELGTMDLGLGDPVNCINRARLQAVGGSTYADIKALMSASDRVVDLGVGSKALAGASSADIARMRNLPRDRGIGDDTGLLLLYPISKDSAPTRASNKTRVPLDAVEHMLGVGIVFPDSKSRSATIGYVTSNVAALPVDVEQPDDNDMPEEPEVEAA